MEIFSYELSNAWGFTISKLSLSETDGIGTVICSYYGNDDNPVQGYRTGEESFSSKVDVSSLERIKNIIRENKEIFGFEKLESPFVLDGYTNNFVFGLKDLGVKEIKGYNLWAYIDKNNKWGSERDPIMAMKVIEVFQGISEILKDQGVPEKYLSLDIA